MPNECTPSTTWEWRRVKVRRRPQGTSTARRRRSTGAQMAPRNAVDPLQIVVRYRGGAEAWWRIDARGETYIMPGWVDIESAFRMINDGNPGVSRGRQDS